MCIKDTVYEYFVQIYPCLISEERQNCLSLRRVLQRNRDSQETCYPILTHSKMNGGIYL